MGNTVQNKNIEWTTKAFRENYEELIKINDQCYGEGWIYRNKNNNHEVFLKQEFSFDSQEYKKKINGIKAQKKIEHPNLVSIMGYTTDKEEQFCSKHYKTMIVFEYFSKNLLDEMTLRKKQELNPNENEIWHFLECLIYGLSYLQELGVWHGSLGSQTILDSEDGIYKILNCSILNNYNSFAKLITEPTKSHKFLYISPILMKCLADGNWQPTHDNFKSDVFSLGIICLEYISLIPSNEIYNYHKFVIYDDLITKRLENIREKYSIALYDFLQNMLIINEEKRLNFIELRILLEKIILHKRNKNLSDSLQIRDSPIPLKTNYLTVQKKKLDVLPINPIETSIKQLDNSFLNRGRPAQTMDASYSYSNIPYSLDIPIHLQKTPLTNYTNENNAYERIQNFYFSESKQFVKNENNYNQTDGDVNNILTKYGLEPLESNRDEDYLVKSGKTNLASTNDQYKIYQSSHDNYDVPQINKPYTSNKIKNSPEKIQNPYEKVKFITTIERYQTNTPKMLSPPKGRIDEIEKEFCNTIKIFDDNINNEKKDDEATIYSYNYEIHNTDINDYDKKNLPKVLIKMSPGKSKGNSDREQSFQPLFSFRGTNKDSSMISHDFELSRPYELKTNYKKYEIVVEKYEDGTSYEGEKIDDERMGKGRFYFEDGSYYDGDWVEGKKQGHGVLYYCDGNTKIYEGKWLNDKFSGQGILYNIFSEELWTRYEGEFSEGVKNGKGVLVMKNGKNQVGNFKNNKFLGQ